MNQIWIIDTYCTFAIWKGTSLSALFQKKPWRYIFSIVFVTLSCPSVFWIGLTLSDCICNNTIQPYLLTIESVPEYIDIDGRIRLSTLTPSVITPGNCKKFQPPPRLLSCRRRPFNSSALNEFMLPRCALTVPLRLLLPCTSLSRVSMAALDHGGHIPYIYLPQFICRNRPHRCDIRHEHFIILG